MGKAKKDVHPKKDFGAITQVGLKARKLAQDHQAALEPRLPAGTIDGLTADLHKLGVDVPDAIVQRVTSQTATKSQDVALVQGYALVTAIRTAVQRRGASEEVRKGYGVGVRTSPKVVKQVMAAITLILERAAAQPGEAAGLGILQKDLVALEQERTAIGRADASQEMERALSPGSTKERNRTANRILEAVDAIVAAGVVEFAKVAEKRAEFEALVSGSGSGGKKNSGEEGGKGENGKAESGKKESGKAESATAKGGKKEGAKEEGAKAKGAKAKG